MMGESKTVRFPQIDQSDNGSQLNMNRSVSSRNVGQRRSINRQSSLRNSIIQEYEQTPAQTVKKSEFEQKKQNLYYSRQEYQNNKLNHRKNSVYLKQDNHNTYKQSFITERNILQINKINGESQVLLKKVKQTQDIIDQVINQNENMLDNNQNKLSQIYDLKEAYKNQGIQDNDLKRHLKQENKDFLKNQKHNRKLQTIELDLSRLLEALEQKFTKINYERNQYVAILDKKGNTKRYSVQMMDLNSLFLSK